MANDLDAEGKAVLRSYQRDASRLHEAACRSLHGGNDNPFVLLNLLTLAGAVDSPILEALALRAKTALSNESYALVDELAARMLPRAPNPWMGILLRDPPLRRTDVHNQRQLADQALEQRALPADMLEVVVERYPDLLTRHGVSADFPGLVPLVVGRIRSSRVRRADLLHVLATQLRTDLRCLPALQKLPRDQQLRVLAHASNGSGQHLAQFVQALGTADLTAFKRAMAVESPRILVRVELSELEPAGPGIAAGIRAILSGPGPFRVEVRGFDNAGKGTKERWINWLLGEWKARRIPQGRAETSRWKGHPDSTDRTNPFELLMALGVDVSAHFEALAAPDYDNQRARLLDAWCAGPVPRESIGVVLSNLATYGPHAFRAGIRCAANHPGDAAWLDPIARALETAPDDRVRDHDTFQTLCEGPWAAPDREKLALALAKRGSAGQVEAHLLRYTGIVDSVGRERRIRALSEAFRTLIQLDPRTLDEGQLSYAFVVAADLVRARLHQNGTLQTHPKNTDAVSRELDEAAGRVTAPTALRPVLESTRNRAKGGVRRWAFSL